MPMLDPAMFDPAFMPQDAITALSPNPWTGLDPFTAAAQRLRGGTIRGRQEAPPSPAIDPNRWDSGASAIPFMDATPNASLAAASPATDLAPVDAPPLPPPQTIGMLNNPGAAPPMDAPPPATPDMAALSGAYGSDRPPPPSATDIPSTSLLGRLGKKIGGPIGDVIGGFGDWAHDNRSTLMALGAGMAGSQSLGQGLNRGMTLAIPAQQADIAQQKQNQTAKWLVEQKHMPPQEAEALVNNPEMMKQLLPRILGARNLKWTDISTDPITGTSEKGWVDDASGQVFDRFMRPLQPGAGGASTSGNIDSSLIGEEYLNQKAIAPEMRAAVKDYIASMSMPTGNPRKGPTQAVKFIAEKYANDLGIPVDEAGFAGRRKMVVDMKSSSPSSMGGILSNGKSAFEHLATVSEKLAGLGNYNGPDVPGGGNIGLAANYVGNKILPTPQTKGSLAGAADALGKYGAESTKFYAGTGGGEAERMSALKNTDPATTSSIQQAEFLETEKTLMLGRMHQKEAQIRTEMGQAFLDKHPVMDADLREKIATIDANIAKLRGQAAGAAPAAATAAPAAAAPAAAAPITATNPKTGVKVRLEGDRWVPVQ